MPPRIIRPKDDTLPCFVLPSYDDTEESFAPFVRLKEPTSAFLTLKQYVGTLTVFLIRIFCILCDLTVTAAVAIVATIGYDPTDLNDLATPLSRLRWWCFRFVRFCGRSGLFFYGFHDLNITHYSYKDMEEKFGYVAPVNIQHDADGQEVHPKCNIVASNHLGFADILFLLWYYDGAFVSKLGIKNVFGIGAICQCMQSLFVEPGKSTTQQLTQRVKFTHAMHENTDCQGCSLCLSNMCIFPEGTSTNGDDMLMFRTGIFTAGLPVRPVVMKCRWKRCNTAWETIYFRQLSYKVMSQFTNNLEVVIGPPYIPSEAEKQDPLLYAYNMNILMAQMLGLNNQGKKPMIYLTNRNVKAKCYHSHAVFGTSIPEICAMAKPIAESDPLIAKYLNMIKEDPRYLYDGDILS